MFVAVTTIQTECFMKVCLMLYPLIVDMMQYFFFIPLTMLFHSLLFWLIKSYIILKINYLKILLCINYLRFIKYIISSFSSTQLGCFSLIPSSVAVLFQCHDDHKSCLTNSWWAIYKYYDYYKNSVISWQSHLVRRCLYGNINQKLNGL